jgi:DNA-binding protein HU-beta
MNKADLIQEITKKVGITSKQAGDCVDNFVDGIKAALKKGQRVSLVGFGSWEVKKRAARKGINPQTGKPIKIAARKYPKFNPGKALRDLVK